MFTYNRCHRSYYCDDICFMWTWLKESDRHLYNIEKFPEKLRQGVSVTPIPGPVPSWYKHPHCWRVVKSGISMGWLSTRHPDTTGMGSIKRIGSFVWELRFHDWLYVYIFQYYSFKLTYSTMPIDLFRISVMIICMYKKMCVWQ